MSTGSASRVETDMRLGRYRLLERIGGGATSVVYSADDEAYGRPVAVKMIVADLEKEPETRTRFYREAMVTSQLRHRNIVTVLDMGEDQGRSYIVMELLKGAPLGVFLRLAVAPPLDTKLSLITQLYEGLQAAHDHGVVHRDIKPGNLFVQDDGCLKILDFGLARLQTSTLTANGQIVGTPDFMSPEQSEGRRVDARSDIFSAAAVSYMILTGRSPFAASDLRKTLQALMESDPLPLTPAEGPEELNCVLFKALAKDPEKRYQRSSEILTDLRSAQVGMVRQ